MKTLITENIIDDQENVSNFIILSNNVAPVRIDEDDRKFVVARCADKRYPNSPENLIKSFLPVLLLITKLNQKNNYKW